MYRSAIGSLLIMMGACFTVRAHDVITTKVTWSREISRLVYRHCVSCHHEGGSAFSLVTYELARPWAKAIKEETLERRMPPWGAVKGFGSFQNDRGLTQEDLELIAGWVEGGAPAGDPGLAPKLPNFTGHPAKAQEATSKPSAEIIVEGTLTLKSAATLVGLQAKTVLEGKSVQIVAVLPDGTIDPLLWLYQYKPQFDHAFYLLKPLSLPAGTKIECSPRDAGAISLLVEPGRLRHSTSAP